jgi:hypothetical protein
MSRRLSTIIPYTNKKVSPDADILDNIKTVKQGSIKDVGKLLKDSSTVLFFATANELYACTTLKFKGHHIIFPEPNPVSFYYSLAKGSERDINFFRQKLLLFYTAPQKLPNALKSEVVLFSLIFKFGSVGVIFSFCAIEAFLNQLIPENYTLVRKNKTLNKEQIQRYHGFEEKLTRLVPAITGKDFALAYPKHHAVILRLKKLRDDLIHLKNNKDNREAYYTAIYQEILDLNMMQIVKAVKRMVNFYHKGLIRDIKTK